MLESTEQWRPVVGFEGLYDVSDHGQVRRVGKAARHGASRGGGARLGRILKQKRTKDGRLRVALWRDGHAHQHPVHRLVTGAFIGPCPPGKEVNHIDGIPSNNRLSNLEYVTRSENMVHAYGMGLYTVRTMRGEAGPNAHLTADEVREIRARYQRRVYGTPRLGREFGVDPKTIYHIVSGKSWPESSV